MQDNVPLFISLFLLASCAVLEEDRDTPQPEGRIIFGKSIDSVEIGFDSLTVLRILGRPDRMYGDDFKGFIYRYDQGKYALMFVSISEDPALGLGVIGVVVEPPYNGTTKDGVGIGTSREIGLKYLGKPTTIDTLGWGIFDTYYFSSNRFGFEYRENKIYSIHMARPARSQ